MEDIRHIQRELLKLYQVAGKHGQYQKLPQVIEKLIGFNLLPPKPRFEEERLQFILKHFNPLGKRILDIGGNMGFFTFEMVFHGAEHVVYYENNETYATFTETIVKLLKLEDKITIRKTCFPFEELPWEKYDFAILLNVLHHIGEDFGSKNINRAGAKRRMLAYLNALSVSTKYLALQIGFCWKGNRNLLLFQHGTKAEMIDYICKGTEQYWRVVSIGIPEKIGEKVVYCPLNEKNIRRDDSLGEFLNRPLFILEART